MPSPVEEMPKKAAKDSNGTPAAADAHDERVAGLRMQMAKYNVQAYIVPSEDPHMVILSWLVICP